MQLFCPFELTLLSVWKDHRTKARNKMKIKFFICYNFVFIFTTTLNFFNKYQRFLPVTVSQKDCSDRNLHLDVWTVDTRLAHSALV